MIIGATGAVVGAVVRVRPHPNAQKIWLADVRLSPDKHVVQIVFGGIRRLHPDDLVAVAPPRSRVTVLGRAKPKKMRSRRYRGERSHGMLCSLRELGWVESGMDEVAVLFDLSPGQSLDDIAIANRRGHVKNWFDASDPAEQLLAG